MSPPFQVTDESDGLLEPRMYSYWSSAIVRDGGVLVFVGGADGQVRFFRVDIQSRTVDRLGPLLKYTGTGEGWYFNADQRLYLIDGPRLRRVGPWSPSEDEVVFDISDSHPNCDLWQPHSSDNGRVHSATVLQIVNEGAYPAIGTVVYKDGEQQFYYAQGYALDESQITADGAFLIIKTSPDDDNLVVNLATRDARMLTKADGALGHSDVGDSYMVGADRDHEPRACVKWDLTQPLTMDHRILLAQSADWSGGDLGHVSIRNGRCLISDGRQIRLVPLDGSGKFGEGTVLCEHGMVGDDYDHQVKANLSPCGKVATFMSNRGTDRQDVYLLELP